MRRYLKLYGYVYGSKRLLATLRVLDLIGVILTALIYAFALIFTGVSEQSLIMPIRLIFSTGIPFLAVSLMRRLLDMPRPCKVFLLDFLPNKKEGESFPSRHVFSVFSIGTALCFVSTLLGIFVLTTGLRCLRTNRSCHKSNQNQTQHDTVKKAFSPRP